MHIGIGMGQSLNEPVFYFNISRATFETPLTTVISIDTFRMQPHRKTDKSTICNGKVITMRLR